MSEQDELTIKNICKEVGYIDFYDGKIYIGVGDIVTYETLNELAKTFSTKALSVRSSFLCTEARSEICIENIKDREDNLNAKQKLVGDENERYI